MKPTAGRIVHYKLSLHDVHTIEYERRESNGQRQGNDIREGDIFPALIVRTWGDAEDSAVNLKVQLDGNDTEWMTSRTRGDGVAQWNWPPRE